MVNYLCYVCICLNIYMYLYKNVLGSYHFYLYLTEICYEIKSFTYLFCVPLYKLLNNLCFLLLINFFFFIIIMAINL